jgi:molybdate transport system substrate-binding protein
MHKLGVTSRSVIVPLWTIFVVVFSSGFAGAADLRFLHTTAIKPPMDELIPEFERSTGHKVTATFGPAGAIVDRIEKGEPADVAIATGPQIEALQKEGKILPGSRVDLAKVGIGVYARKGGPKPDVSSIEAFKRALMAAKSIAYIDPASGGASGIYLSGLLQRLGLAVDMRAKTKSPRVVAAVFDAVATGEAELGLGQLSEIVADPGIELVGLLPTEIQNFTLFAAGIIANSKEQEAGKSLVAFISSPGAQVIMKSKGFEAP